MPEITFEDLDQRDPLDYADGICLTCIDVPLQVLRGSVLGCPNCGSEYVKCENCGEITEEHDGYNYCPDCDLKYVPKTGELVKEG